MCRRKLPYRLSKCPDGFAQVFFCTIADEDEVLKKGMCDKEKPVAENCKALSYLSNKNYNSPNTRSCFIEFKNI